jgi:putative lipoic acid-binding regulatory protein
MEACLRPEITFPCRVPLKVIGKIGVLDPARVAALIQEHLGPQAEEDREPSVKQKGPYLSYTFWVTLPDEGAESPLRLAIHALPGCVMQL